MTWPASDVDVLAQLDVTLRAQDHQPAVTPGRKALRGVPVDPDETVGGLGSQGQLAVVLHPWGVGMGVVGDRAGDDLGGVGAGEEEELVDLVAGDVSQDAAGPFPVIEPVGSAGTPGEVGTVALPVRTEPEGLHDLADPAGPDELACLDRTAHLEPLREGHRPEAAGLAHRLL